jgi:hypothetical protein
VAVGETTYGLRVDEGAVQVYVLPPEAVSVADPPEQIVLVAGEAVIVDPGITLMIAVFVSTHPKLLLVLAVYVVVTEGQTVTGLALEVNPGAVMVYVAPPNKVAVTQLPAHTVLLLMAAVKVGVGFTVMLTVFVLEQPPVLILVTV